MIIFIAYDQHWLPQSTGPSGPSWRLLIIHDVLHNHIIMKVIVTTADIICIYGISCNPICSRFVNWIGIRWVSSTDKSLLAITYCYQAIQQLMTFQQVWTIKSFAWKFVLHLLIIYVQARRACQRQRSILLEFDTRGEVEDFQRLVQIFSSEIYKFCQKFPYSVRNLHILVLYWVLRWGMSTLVWNLTGWSGLESLTTRFLKFLLFGLSLIIVISWDFATNTTWWTRAWCWTSHQMWRIKRASIVPILSKYYLYCNDMSSFVCLSATKGRRKSNWCGQWVGGMLAMIMIISTIQF